MGIDFDSIRNDNIREYGEGTRHLSFLGRLYANKTHFVYELLQNAEDAQAHKIMFSLYNDRLEVKHDGRPFNESDVRGICGVGEGTKEEDLTKIGKFGIGFKSVYAYTLSPEVHCGDNHFEIRSFVRPHAIEAKLVPADWTTLFVFPFSENMEEAPQEAYKQISKRLVNLNARTLLFLKHIDEISYDISSGLAGTYLRDTKKFQDYRQVTVIGQDSDSEIGEQWIVFSRQLTLEDHDLNSEIAFRLSTNSNGQPMIERLRQSMLTAYFPTEQETHLGFLIQGPYRTTPARDNIPKEDPWNKTLVKETAELLANSLRWIKEAGMLTVSLLDALPIRTGDYPEDWMFWPLHKATVRAFKEEALLPTDNDDYVLAGRAKLSRGERLRGLLKPEQLTCLVGDTETVYWLSGDITRDRTPELRRYILEDLDIEEIDPDSFARKLSQEFLNMQPDDWFVEFYGFLAEQKALWRKPQLWESGSVGILRHKPILRLEDDALVTPFDGDYPNAYIPPESSTELPIIKRSIAIKASDFLEALGLTQPDVFDDVLKHVLPKYDGIVTCDGGTDYCADVKRILTLLASDSESGKNKLLKRAKQTAFIWCSDGQQQKLLKPSDVYLPTPDLTEYFTNANVWFICQEIYTLADRDKWLLMGCHELPKKLPSRQMPTSVRREHSTRSEPIENCDLDGLTQYLARLEGENDAEIQKRLSLLLWKLLGTLFKNDRYLFKGTYHWFYYSPQSKTFNSLIYERLHSATWIVTKTGELCSAANCRKDDLLEEQLASHELLEALGIKESLEDDGQEVLRSIGFDEEIADIIMKNRQFLTKDSLLDLIQRNKESADPSRPVFPEHEPSQAERRSQKVKERYEEAEPRMYGKKERSLRLSSPDHDTKTWLKGLYENQDGIMVCQMCENEMPFKLRNGEYYFEAVQISDDHEKEYHELYLALCPLCAAKYKYLVKGDQPTLKEFLARLKKSGSECKIRIDLGANGAHSIRFVRTHLLDIGSIIGEDNIAQEDV